jgi:hypothetical protein
MSSGWQDALWNVPIGSNGGIHLLAIYQPGQGVVLENLTYRPDMYILQFVSKRHRENLGKRLGLLSKYSADLLGNEV